MKEAIKGFVVLVLGLFVVGCSRGPSSANKTIAPSPGSSLKAVQQAGIALQKGNLAKARKSFEKIKTDYPDDPFAWASAGAFYAAINDQESAILAFEKANEMGPFAGVEQSLSALYFKKGLPVRASAHARNALTISEGLPLSWLLLADSELSQGNWEAAYQAGQKAVRHFPDDGALQASLGDGAQRLDKHAEAKKAYRRALALNAGNARAAIGLAGYLQASGKKKEAIHLLRACLKARKNPDAQIALSRLLIQDRKTAKEALSLSAQAFAQMPDNPDYKFQLALNLMALGNLKDSRVLLEEVVTSRPLSLNPWLALERVYFRLGELDRAQKILESLLVNPRIKLDKKGEEVIEKRLTQIRNGR